MDSKKSQSLRFARGDLEDTWRAGSTFCQARASLTGETEQRLYCLSAWRETAFYSERERAALTWTEAVKLVSEDHVPDDVFDFARKQFPEEELADLTLAIVSINGWKRFSIAFRAPAGTYQSAGVHRSRRNNRRSGCF